MTQLNNSIIMSDAEKYMKRNSYQQEYEKGKTNDRIVNLQQHFKNYELPIQHQFNELKGDVNWNTNQNVKQLFQRYSEKNHTAQNLVTFSKAMNKKVIRVSPWSSFSPMKNGVNDLLEDKREGFSKKGMDIVNGTEKTINEDVSKYCERLSETEMVIFHDKHNKSENKEEQIKKINLIDHNLDKTYKHINPAEEGSLKHKENENGTTAASEPFEESDIRIIKVESVLPKSTVNSHNPEEISSSTDIYSFQSALNSNTVEVIKYSSSSVTLKNSPSSSSSVPGIASPLYMNQIPQNQQVNPYSCNISENKQLSSEEKSCQSKIIDQPTFHQSIPAYTELFKSRVKSTFDTEPGFSNEEVRRIEIKRQLERQKRWIDEHDTKKQLSAQVEYVKSRTSSTGKTFPNLFHSHEPHELHQPTAIAHQHEKYFEQMIETLTRDIEEIQRERHSLRSKTQVNDDLQRYHADILESKLRQLEKLHRKQYEEFLENRNKNQQLPAPPVGLENIPLNSTEAPRWQLLEFQRENPIMQSCNLEELHCNENYRKISTELERVRKINELKEFYTMQLQQASKSISARQFTDHLHNQRAHILLQHEKEKMHRTPMIDKFPNLNRTLHLKRPTSESYAPAKYKNPRLEDPAHLHSAFYQFPPNRHYLQHNAVQAPLKPPGLPHHYPKAPFNSNVSRFPSLPVTKTLPTIMRHDMHKVLSSCRPDHLKEPNVMVKNDCNFCKQAAKFLCSGCHEHWYCSQKCQLSDWKDHSKVCLRTK